MNLFHFTPGSLPRTGKLCAASQRPALKTKPFTPLPPAPPPSSCSSLLDYMPLLFLLSLSSHCSLGILPAHTRSVADFPQSFFGAVTCLSVSTQTEHDPRLNLIGIGISAVVHTATGRGWTGLLILCWPCWALALFIKVTLPSPWYLRTVWIQSSQYQWMSIF